MIQKVVTGGQRGADQAGWRAAKASGIATGGWMPAGFRTETPDGTGWGERHPEFAQLYGARMHASPDYPPRNVENARMAEACIYFTWTGWSRGMQSTIDAIQQASGPRRLYPFMKVDMAGPAETEMVEFLGENDIRVLWVAGNRESISPGIGAWVEAYLTEVFRLMRD